MGTPIDITLRVSDDGSIQLLDSAANKINEIGSAADKSTTKTREAGMSLADMKAGFDMLKQGATQAYQLVDATNSLGVSSLRAKAALDVLSEGKATEYIDAMRASTRGLVDDMSLAQIATKALTLGLVSTADQAAKLAQAGAILGNTMGIGATQGVETLTLAMSRVGLTGLLDNIGLSGAKVKIRFQELKDTLGDQAAWSTAVLEEAATKTDKLKASLDGTGTALERVKASASNFLAHYAENVAVGIDSTLRFIDVLHQLGSVNTNVAQGAGTQNNLINQGTGGGFTMGVSGGSGKTSGVYKGDAVVSVSESQVAQAILAGQITYEQGMALLTSTGKQAFTVKRAGEFDQNAFKPYGSNGDLTLQRKGELDSGKVSAALDAQNNLRMAYDDEQQSLDYIRKQKQSILDIDKVMGDSVRSQSVEMQKQAVIAAEVAAAKRASGVAGAFGLQQDGIYGEVDPFAGGTVNTALDNYTKNQRKKIGRKDDSGVYTKKEFDFDTAQFQRDAKSAMDDYAIATGAATKESIAFQNVTAKLKGDFENGRISASQLAKEIKVLADAAKSGATSMDEIHKYSLQFDLNAQGNTKQRAQTEKNLGEKDLLPTPVASGQPDPGKAYRDAKEAAHDFGTSATDAGKQAVQAIQPVIGAAAKMAGALSAAADQAARVRREVNGIPGSKTVDIRIVQSGGGRKDI